MTRAEMIHAIHTITLDGLDSPQGYYAWLDEQPDNIVRAEWEHWFIPDHPARLRDKPKDDLNEL